ncbi:hypothetical protein HK098_006591 [Nowakowskiella sp. JEL0407]|nr:hypothetical protein HK098_006591 [Nowakowskiella sp. JEL0407]
MKKFSNIFRSEKKTSIYYYPNDNINAIPQCFSVSIDFKNKTCADFLAEIILDSSSPVFGVDDLAVHITSLSARSAFPADFILSPSTVFKDIQKNRKLWIVRQPKKDTSLSVFTVNINYREEGAIREYQIDIPSIELEQSDPYNVLIRKAKNDAPSQFTPAETSETVSFTMTPPNSKNPGCKDFTKGYFTRLQKKEIKLWIEKKIPFEVIDQTKNSETDAEADNTDNQLGLEFYPEQHFGFIKWILAMKLKCDIQTFNIVAKHRHTSVETSIRQKDKLCSFSEHNFYIRTSNRPHANSRTWLCKHNRNQFDLFFSHRQWADQDIVREIHHQLHNVEHPKDQGRIIHPFWDVECLLTAEDWEAGFLSALHQSNVAVLFISKNCLQKIMNADLEADNMLLEWEETLQRYPSQNLIVFPIHVGRDGKKFDGFNHLLFPDEQHCHPRSPKVLTVRKIVQEIFRIQGESLVELSGQKLEETKTKLLNTLSKIAERKSTTANVQSPLTNLILTSSQDQQLWDLLNPLSKEMKAERTRLLNAHVPNTRLWLLKSLMEFLDPKNSTGGKERVLWLQGNAGVGKSVMSAFAANELEKRNLLAGMFFAKHDDTGRNSARILIRTLCYQLCEWNADFGRLILENLKDEMVVFEALREQAKIEKMFEHLLLNPLNEIAQTELKPVVLVVDALDETGMIGYRSEILQVFSVHCKKLPAFVKLLITSRPEEDIVKTFRKLKTKQLEATSSENREDAMIYSKSFLREQGLSPEEVENLAELLSEKSGGLFVWLAMACRILESLTAIGMPITRQVIEKLGDGGSDKAMDAIYFSTFDRVFGLTPPDAMKDVLALITVAYEPLKAEDISLLLEISLEDVEENIDKLQPILYLTEAGTIRLFHKSVADYLTSSKRCSDPRFSIQTHQYHTTFARKCLAILQNLLTYNIAELPLHRLHKDILGFDQIVSEHVSGGLKYAAFYFWRHHSESHTQQTNFQAIRTFTETKLLNWIELLCLVKSTRIIPTATKALSENYTSPDSATDYTIELLSDAKRLYQKFNFAISDSALQTYVTAIPFSPKQTRIYLHYFDNLPTKMIPRVITGSGTKWSACLATLETQDEIVWSVATSPDGNYIAAGSDYGYIRLFSTESGEEVKKIDAHVAHVFSMAFSADGSFIVSGSYDQTVKISSVESGELIKTLRGHLGAVRSVAISTDGTFVVSGSDDKCVKIWSIANGKVIRTLTGHSREVKAVAISKDSELIVSGSEDQTIKIWSVASGEEMKTLTGHRGYVESVAISMDGKIIVSGSEDRTVKIWSLESGELEKSLNGYHGWVNSVAISLDGELIVSGSREGTVTIWSLESGEEVKTFTGHSRAVYSLLFSMDGKFIFSGGMDGTVKIWSVDGVEENMSSSDFTSVYSAYFSSDGRYVKLTSLSLDKVLFEFESGQKVDSIDPETLEYADDRQDKVFFDGTLLNDGWIAVGNDLFCWLPSEFRKGETAMNLWFVIGRERAAVRDEEKHKPIESEKEREANDVITFWMKRLKRKMRYEKTQREDNGRFSRTYQQLKSATEKLETEWEF